MRESNLPICRTLMSLEERSASQGKETTLDGRVKINAAKHLVNNLGFIIFRVNFYVLKNHTLDLFSILNSFLSKFLFTSSKVFLQWKNIKILSLVRFFCCVCSVLLNLSINYHFYGPLCLWFNDFMFVAVSLFQESKPAPKRVSPTLNVFILVSFICIYKNNRERIFFMRSIFDKAVVVLAMFLSHTLTLTL